MNELLKSDMHSISSLLEMTQKLGVDYLSNIEMSSTTTAGKHLSEAPGLPMEGLGTKNTLQLFNNTLRELMVASSGPRYLGFVTGGTTPASIVGDWLATVYDQNSFATTGEGDVSALIELKTIELLLTLFDLPKTFLGGFVTGATISNFTCLAIARQWLGKQQSRDVAKEGMTAPFNVLSATPHSSAIKSLSMLGMGSQNLKKVKTLPGNREAIDPDDLERQLQQLNGEPSILISSGGTVNTVDFDDMQAIARLKERYSFWWHIDAAFGAFAALSPAHRHLLSGWEHADSITVDGHKWLNVPYDCAVFLIRQEYKLVQVETFQNANAPYLGDPMANFTYLNFLPENSRRLRSLPAWFTLMAYGRNGYQDIVENSIHLAKTLGERIEASSHFKLLAPVRLNTVCFTLTFFKEDPDKVKHFLSMLNTRGKVFMTPTFYNNAAGIRAAFVNWRTTENDLRLILEEMEEVYRSIK
ncbi:MAG TPA: pyridoxal-dependent decarboxylase [Flavisolibacter sp.]|nr:pyridoxal-dependent decarboxylase [Flavisolibacter sp.]